MRITLLTIGSRGDTQPFIALAVRLMQNGHSVKLAAPPDFAAIAAKYRIDFAPIGSSMQDGFSSEKGAKAMESGNLLKHIRFAMKQRQNLFSVLNQGIWHVIQDTEAIIYRNGAIEGYNIAEKCSIPCAEVGFFPLTRTREAPNFLFGGGKDRGPLFNWLLGLLAEQIVWQMFLRNGANMQRRKWLNLPPLPFFGPFARQNRENMPLFYPYSSTVLPRPSDWPDRIHVPGYWFLDPPPDWQAPPDLLQFLQNGPAPIYIGFGSMPNQQPEATLDLILKALKLSGQRGILLSGWAGIGQNLQLPEDVFKVEDIPHSWLFPRMAAVVHHGGAGTMGAGLLSGVPSIITPFSADQPGWARLAHALGVSPAPLRYQTLTAEQLAEAIHEAVTNTTMRQRAAEIGKRLQAEDGLGRTIEIFLQYVDKKSNAPPLWKSSHFELH